MKLGVVVYFLFFLFYFIFYGTVIIYIYIYIYICDTTEAIITGQCIKCLPQLEQGGGLAQCPATTSAVVNYFEKLLSLTSSTLCHWGGEITSAKGITQGDPLSMAFYPLATVPLISHLEQHCQNV